MMCLHTYEMYLLIYLFFLTPISDIFTSNLTIYTCRVYFSIFFSLEIISKTRL